MESSGDEKGLLVTVEENDNTFDSLWKFVYKSRERKEYFLSLVEEVDDLMVAVDILFQCYLFSDLNCVRFQRIVDHFAGFAAVVMGPPQVDDDGDDSALVLMKKIESNARSIGDTVISLHHHYQEQQQEDEQKEVDMWVDIANNLRSRILDDEAACGKAVIELIYQSLPDSLKACFLYIGAFLEDKKIIVQKLLCLWIAERFVVGNEELKNPEEVAMNYLTDLVGRSLLTVAEVKSMGGVK